MRITLAHTLRHTLSKAHTHSHVIHQIYSLDEYFSYSFSLPFLTLSLLFPLLSHRCRHTAAHSCRVVYPGYVAISLSGAHSPSLFSHSFSLSFPFSRSLTLSHSQILFHFLAHFSLFLVKLCFSLLKGTCAAPFWGKSLSSLSSTNVTPVLLLSLSPFLTRTHTLSLIFHLIMAHTPQRRRVRSCP